jgi:hypothetical protein
MPQTQQVQLPAAEDAYGLLYEQIHAPVFFQKLAQDYGIVPANDEQAARLLQMGADLFLNDRQEQEKQAASRGDFIAQAQEQLDRILGKQGSHGPANPANDRLVKQAASQLARNPHVRAAALAYQYHLTNQS